MLCFYVISGEAESWAPCCSRGGERQRQPSGRALSTAPCSAGRGHCILDVLPFLAILFPPQHFCFFDALVFIQILLHLGSPQVQWYLMDQGCFHSCFLEQVWPLVEPAAQS